MDDLGVSQKSYPYFLGQSTWVYSKRNGILSYDATMFPKNPVLTKGWNFVSITPYLIFSDNDLDKFLGTCKDKILVSYIFQTDTNKWEQVRNDELDGLAHGVGGIIKVVDDCVLRSQEPVGGIIPTLPQGVPVFCNDTDSGKYPKVGGETLFSKDGEYYRDMDDCVKISSKGNGFLADDGKWYNQVSDVCEGKVSCFSADGGNCKGENCYVLESYCEGDKNNLKAYKCSLCNKGQCLN